MRTFLNKKNILILILFPIFVVMVFGVFFFYSWLASMLTGWLRVELNLPQQWFHWFMDVLFLGLIGLVSWLIFKSRLPDPVKAVYSMFPSMIFCYAVMDERWIAISYAIDVLAYALVTFLLIRKKKPWFYLYAITLVALFLLYMVIFQVEP